MTNDKWLILTLLVANLLIMLETKHIEYKQKVTPELEKEVVAFLNSEGGAIYIGVDKEGHTVGVASADAL